VSNKPADMMVCEGVPAVSSLVEVLSHASIDGEGQVKSYAPTTDNELATEEQLPTVAARTPGGQEARKRGHQEAKKPGGQEAKMPKHQEARGPGCQEARKPRSQEARRPGGQVARKLGRQDARRLGSEEARRPGDEQHTTGTEAATATKAAGCSK